MQAFWQGHLAHQAQSFVREELACVWKALAEVFWDALQPVSACLLGCGLVSQSPC